MANNQNPSFSENQKAMLDLALACDLKVSDPNIHPAIQARHKTITNHQSAADYIREVEDKIHSRRKVKFAHKTH